MVLTRILAPISALVLACDPSSKSETPTKSGSAPVKAAPEPAAPKAAPAAVDAKQSQPQAKAPDPAEPPADADGDDDFALLRAEEVEGIKIDMTGKDVEAKLGKAKTKTAPEFEEATGDWIAVWAFPAKGIELGMASTSEHEPPSVSTINIGTTSKAKTSRGIGVGSTLGELKKAYGKERDNDMSSEDIFIAGSVYGGIGFQLERGRVASIFIGAMAE